MDNTKNFAKVTVSTGYDASATSIVLSSGNGAKLPTPPCNVTWWNFTDYSDPSDDPSVEIVRVTSVSTDTLTVTRAQEGTTATVKNVAGKTYRMLAGLTAKVLNTDVIDAGNLTTGTLPSGRLTGAYTGITSVGTLSGLTVTAAITGSVTGSSGSCTGNSLSATTAGTVTTAAQPAITSVGTLTGLTVTAPITGSITGSSGSCTGNALSATTAGTVTTAAQPAITSLGTLTGLSISSSTLVTNLNADKLDNQEGSWYQQALGYTPINKAGDTGIAALTLTGALTGTTATLNSATINGPCTTNLTGLSIYTDVAYYVNDVASQTGTIKIQLPVSWTNTMLGITIQGYNYSTQGAWTCQIGGYNYSTSTYWVNCTAKTFGSVPFSSVRFGHDGTYCCILPKRIQQ